MVDRRPYPNDRQRKIGEWSGPNKTISTCCCGLQVFEVEDLRNASPATVSRAGVVYVSATDLDWKPVLDAWLSTRPQHMKTLEKHMYHFLGDPSAGGPRDFGIAFDFVARLKGSALSVTRVCAIENVVALLSALLNVADLSESTDDVYGELERLVLFAVTWGIAGLLDVEGRKLWDAWLRDGPARSSNLPQETSIFEYAVDLETMEWERWQPSEFQKPCADVIDWSTVRVPTMESCRGIALMERFALVGKPVLVVGGPGTGKTTLVHAYFRSCDPENVVCKTLNLSSATTPGMLQNAIEVELEKQGGKNFGPAGGNRMMCVTLRRNLLFLTVADTVASSWTTSRFQR